MIPTEKIQALVAKHDNLEKELSTGTIDSKTFAQKSKEYSDLGSIILCAREYLQLDNDRKELEQILQDKDSDSEMKSLTEKEIEMLKKKRN
jgi:peptide chain release factor 1